MKLWIDPGARLGRHSSSTEVSPVLRFSSLTGARLRCFRFSAIFSLTVFGQARYSPSELHPTRVLCIHPVLSLNRYRLSALLVMRAKPLDSIQLSLDDGFPADTSASILRTSRHHISSAGRKPFLGLVLGVEISER